MSGKAVSRAIRMIAILTVLTGLVYPFAITGLAQLLFPRSANGSLLTRNGTVIGSGLIGQPFTDPKYFQGRPSATAPFADNAALSAASNDAPTSPALLQTITRRAQELRHNDPSNAAPIPVDLVTASGSGLDPHISIASALYQLPRVARVRGLDSSSVRALVDRCTEGRTFGLLGEPRVNVLRLNLALDRLEEAPR